MRSSLLWCVSDLKTRKILPTSSNKAHVQNKTAVHQPKPETYLINKSASFVKSGRTCIQWRNQKDFDEPQVSLQWSSFQSATLSSQSSGGFTRVLNIAAARIQGRIPDLATGGREWPRSYFYGNGGISTWLANGVKGSAVRGRTDLNFAALPSIERRHWTEIYRILYLSLENQLGSGASGLSSLLELLPGSAHTSCGREFKRKEVKQFWRGEPP